ncbi:hypothetical protein EDB87DRAFT_1412376 [Lactarius vividus]|nr:hypothetical protein EDB87DRAFT_1412376 [Lactarius vividus]
MERWLRERSAVCGEVHMRSIPCLSTPTLLLQKSDEWGRTMTINFVLLRSPLLAFHDPETIIVSQELFSGSSLPEILWNFSRYKDCARITLEQNPHFYLRCPANESAYTPTFQRYPLQDPRGALEHNDTVYVLFDRPSRVFLDTEHKPRIFGNVWLLNGSLIFRDDSGVLEGEQLIRSSSIRGKLWYCEQPVVSHDSEFRSRLNHRCLRPIVTTPFGDSLTGGTFEDWKVLSRPASHSINIHIYDSRGFPKSASSLDLPPPPPTSERPGYPVHYTTINTLGDDVLLVIFNYYRLRNQYSWNVRLGWCKLSHVCRRWRYLAYSSPSHLGMCIPCTNGAPILATLDHLPSLPLFVDYWYVAEPISEQDKLGIYYALLQRDRIRRINLHLPPLFLHKFLMLVDEPFPILEHLSLSFTADKITTLTLPKTFLAPNLRHLALFGIGLPKKLRFLSTTVSLVTLVLTNIRASGYFLPSQLVARLQSLPQLETLSIGFSIPIPRPRVERELLGKLGNPVMLPSLKNLAFRGVSTYLERLVAQISAPLLERLNVTLFNQIAFSLPHLSLFTNRTEGLKLPTAKVIFWRDAVYISTDHYSTRQYDGCFILRVMSKQLDWQIDCAAQICSALVPALSGVETLTLNFHEQMMPSEWQDGEIDGATWHQLLRSFTGVKKLCICSALSEELSRALEVEGTGSDPELLPGLQELVSDFEGKHTDRLFGSFVHARWVAGRPVRSLLRVPP